MGNKRGNPAWVKGKSANPKGRPIGQTGLASYLRDPSLFTIRHLRWERFCWGLMEPPYTGAAAARKAGYSPKSARFIASRLLKKDVIRELLRRIRERINSARKIEEHGLRSLWMMKDYLGEYYFVWSRKDHSGKYHVYRSKK